MQYAKYFLSMVGISLAIAMAPGCDNDPSQGAGGEGGEPSWGEGGASVGSTSSGMNASSSSGTSGSTSSGTSGSTSSGSMGDAEPPAMNGMTAAHNAARASVSPPASPAIPPLVWDGGIAAVAQAYAENCVFKHSSNQYGENLFASAGGGTTPQSVVDSWVSEAADYNYASNSCSGVCGHYTQVVWAKTARLGCGMAQCSKNSPFMGFPNWEIWVCNYDPPGNFVGEKPY